MKTIKITRGKEAIVDDEDYEELVKYRWHCTDNGYAKRCGRASENRLGEVISMHREILDAPDHLQVDHINHDRLDNRKENLRLVTPFDNARNRGMSSRNTSGYKGVSKNHKIWEARICINGNKTNIGGFSNPVDAARAYDRRAVELFGEFAFLNFPNERN